MEIFVFGREEIETGIVVKSSYVVISIHDPNKRRPKVKKQSGLRDVLYLAFSGIEPPADPRLSAENDFFTPAQAEEICAFVHRHKADVGAIVVHCEKGQSRSPAIAAAISEALGLDAQRFWELYTPKKYLYETVSKAFKRRAAAR